MERRTIPGIETAVSVVPFGCGPGAGLMVGDDADAQTDAIAGALERGVNFFDTAAAYGAGKSESALGAALRRLDAHDAAVVLTKVQVGPGDLDHLEAAVLAAGVASRQRLGRRVIDVLLLHNRIGPRDESASGLPPRSRSRRPSKTLSSLSNSCGTTASSVPTDSARSAERRGRYPRFSTTRGPP
jgi:aryl-alcohol dehydrogenase-like predicted oxidoreductase